MITFKQFLKEKAFNQREYRKVLKRNEGALVGFEIEAFLPADHEFSSETAPSGTYVLIRGFDTMAEFEETFDIGTYERRQIENTYGTWLARQEDAYIDDNWENHYSDTVAEEEGRKEAEKQARDAARDGFDKDEYDWTAWFKDEYASAWAFIQEYGLQPKYGWETENGKASTVYTEKPEIRSGDWDAQAAEQIGAELENILKTRIRVKSEPGSDNKTWMIVPDTSIHSGDRNDESGTGIEIVSPPQAPEKALEDLKKVFEFMRRKYIETNVSTGLHVNVSIPGIENLDPLKLVLFMGDEHVLKSFDRLENTMTQPLLTTIVRSIQTHGTLPHSAHELIELARESIDRSKYRSVNLTKLTSGYLEFRAAGNADYHQRYDDIKELVGRYITAIEVACDPKAERNEYIKKFTKLMGRAAEIPGENEVRAMSVVDIIAKKIPSARQLNTDDREKFMRTLAFVGATMSDTYSPSFKQVKELRTLMSDHGVSADDVLNFADGNKQKVALNFSDAHMANLKKFLSIFKLR